MMQMLCYLQIETHIEKEKRIERIEGKYKVFLSLHLSDWKTIEQDKLMRLLFPYNRFPLFPVFLVPYFFSHMDEVFIIINASHCVVFGKEFYSFSAKAKGIKEGLKIQLIISRTSNACRIGGNRADFMSLHSREKMFPRFLSNQLLWEICLSCFLSNFSFERDCECFFHEWCWLIRR